MRRKVIASSMVHIVCACKELGEKTGLHSFNINVEEPLTPELLQKMIRPKIEKQLGTNDFVILTWQRYEM